MIQMKPATDARGEPLTPYAATVTSIKGLESIAAAWRALEAKAPGAVFFQSYDWCGFVWRMIAAQGGVQNIQPRVVLVRAGDDVVAIWPLSIVTIAGGRYAQDLGEPFGQYSDILLATGADAGAVMAVALAEVKSWRIDGIVLRKVRADAGLRTWLDANGTRIGAPEQAPAALLSDFSSFDDYRASLNVKTRKTLRNYRNRLNRMGELRHDVIEDTDKRQAVMERCFLGRTEWLEKSGLSSSAFSDPLFSTLVAGLAKGAHGAPKTFAMRLGLTPREGANGGGSIDLSVHWGFMHNGRYYTYMAAKNPGYDSYSPGRLHMEDLVRACSDRGLATVDFLLPAMPYKLTWATTSVEVQGFGVPLTARGQLFVRGWHGIVRPALKATWLAMPPAARRWAIAPFQALARIKIKCSIRPACSPAAMLPRA